jgi:hypothetical protein
MKEIILKGCDKRVCVDDEDFNWLNEIKWCLHPEGYAQAYIKINGKYVNVLMHRLILGVNISEFHVDHINHNGLDNRRDNIRVCSVSQNHCNRKSFGSSKYLGVSVTKRSYKNRVYTYYVSQISVNNKNIYLGLFKNEIDAASAYDAAASLFHGDFANINLK